jgi:hypothetical protein
MKDESFQKLGRLDGFVENQRLLGEERSHVFYG